MWAGPWPLLVSCVLLLLPRLEASSADLYFEMEPPSRLVKPDEGKANFRCSASNPAAEIRWLYKGQPAPHNRWIKISREKLTVHFGEIDSNLRPPHFLDNAYFQCEIKLKGRVLVSSPASLIVAVLEEFPAQTDVHIASILGNTAVIPCDPPFSVPTVVTEFIFNGTSIKKSTDKIRFMASGDLQIFDAQYEDSGEYVCIADNPFLKKKVTSKRKVFLHLEEPTEQKPASFVKSPRSRITTVLGSNVTLECVAEGNPFPRISWRRNQGTLPDGRYEQIGGNLNLIGVRKEDEGVYFCEAENSVGNMISTSTTIEVQETPQIIKFSKSTTVEDGANVTLSCVTRGHPKPSLTWVHNGKDLDYDSTYKIKGSQLVIHNLTRKNAGIYQCFASNELGSIYASATISVSSRNKSYDSNGFDDYDSDGNKPSSHRKKDKGRNLHKHKSDGSKDLDMGTAKRPHKRKKHKRVKLVPPTKPDISRLSNTSVMVRWGVPRNDGLPVIFFKVQYKEVGTSNPDWKTIDEDIAAHIHSYAVTGLLPGIKYRFRIAAVYSNNDNKSGPISEGFVLSQDTPTEKPSTAPVIIYAEAASPSAITLKWKYENFDSVPIQGFFIHYRASHTAGKYLKVTVLKENTRSHIISHLLPETGYEIKMQCFNTAGASNFSNIVTAKTKAAEVVAGTRNRNSKSQYADDVPISVTENVSSKNSDNFVLYVVLGVVSGILLITVAIYTTLFIRQKQNRQSNCDNASEQEDDSLKMGNGHISGNGYIAVGNKINISVNPLGELDIEDNEKLEDLQDMVSNNNEIIRLQTFNVHIEPEVEPESNNAGMDESTFNGEEKSAVILPSDSGTSAELPENV